MCICVTADGTVCDDEWVGYNGHCYYFNNRTEMDFASALSTCRALDAEVVSILDSDEFDFLKSSRTGNVILV